ncbi:hypothetical protein BU692_00525 [Staphylococcus chromogenes]|nr:hypothetical protein BU692_00525 [Staphylococcus chromogenes]
MSQALTNSVPFVTKNITCLHFSSYYVFFKKASQKQSRFQISWSFIDPLILSTLTYNFIFTNLCVFKHEGYVGSMYNSFSKEALK